MNSELSASDFNKLHEQTGMWFIHRNKHFILRICPMSKPRMVKSDAWKKRPVVLNYWKWKDALVQSAASAGLTEIPSNDFHVIFHMPMPASWPKKKKIAMIGQPHQSKPDADNMMKALQDCLCQSDQHIWDFRVTKLWSDEGRIEIRTI